MTYAERFDRHEQRLAHIEQAITFIHERLAKLEDLSPDDFAQALKQDLAEAKARLDMMKPQQP